MKPLRRITTAAQVIPFPREAVVAAEFVDPDQLARRIRAEVALRLPELDLPKLLELGRLVLG